MDSKKLNTSVIDFIEIHTAHDFELFTHDLLQSMGYRIITPPGEGPDGGRDMIVEETRRGNLSDTKVRYLVSCKHFSNAKAVGTNDEKDVPARVLKHHCDAFLGVYSTHPTNQLVMDFQGWTNNPDKSRAFSASYLDGSGIRKQLLELNQGQRLVKQYFPTAALAHRRLQTESNIYRKRPIFRCTICEINILEKLEGSILVEAMHGPGRLASGDPDRDLRHRLHISDVKAFCPEHAAHSKSNMLNGSVIYSLEEILEPKAFIKIVNSGLTGMYAWPPHFNDETTFILWFRLINGLFYFVARGRDKHLPLDDLAALHAEHFDVQWKL